MKAVAAQPGRQLRDLFDDSKLFLKLWLKEPLKIGSPAASSPELAAAIAGLVPFRPGAPVVELGGGTGRITSALLEAGLPPDRLIVVDNNPTMYGLLRERFPGVHVLFGDAAQLNALIAPLGLPPASAVVSGLPLVSFKKQLRQRIIDEAFAAMEPGAPLIQFTYSLFSPLPRQELGITGRRKARVLRNVPPASVWMFKRPEYLKRAAGF